MKCVDHKRKQLSEDVNAAIKIPPMLIAELVGMQLPTYSNMETRMRKTRYSGSGTLQTPVLVLERRNKTYIVYARLCEPVLC